MGKKYGGEHDGATEKLARGGDFVQDKRAADDGENRFGTHDDGRHGGFGASLTDNLERVRQPATQDAGIQQRQKGTFYRTYLRVFENEHEYASYRARHGELNAGKFYAVGVRREFFDQQNVDGKRNGARRRKDVAHAERRYIPGLKAQKIQSDKAENDAYPGDDVDFLFEKYQSQKRHEKHINGGDESDFARRRAGYGKGVLL